MIILGLGKYGNEIVQNISKLMEEQDNIIFKIVSCLALKDNGEFWDIKEDKLLFQCENLKSEFHLYNYSSNFQSLQCHEKSFEDHLVDKISHLKRKELLVKFQDQGLSIDNNIEIFIISPLFDSVGSAAIIPFLGFIQTLLAGRLRGSIIKSNLFLLFPDLFPDYRNKELAFARSYVSMEELDFIADHPELISSEGLPPFDFAWIMTGKNEEDIELGSYQSLIPMIKKFFMLIFKGDILNDVSFTNMLINKVEGKTTRYSSVGLSQLIFPVDEVIKGLSKYVGFLIFQSKGLTEEKIFDRELINTNIKKFVIENRFDELSEEMKTDPDGHNILMDFSYEGDMYVETNPEVFFQSVEEAFEEFSKTQFIEMQNKLLQKKSTLYEEKKEKLGIYIKNCIESKEKGIYYTKSFLDQLLNLNSPYVKGKILTEEYNLKFLKNKIRSYFDKEFEELHNYSIQLQKEIKEKQILLDNLKEQKPEEEGKEILFEQINSLEIELKELDDKSNKVNKETKNCKIAKDENNLGSMVLKNKINEIKETIEDLKGKIRDIEDKYIDIKRRLADLNFKKKKTILKNLFILPALGTLGFIVLFYLVTLLPYLTSFGNFKNFFNFSVIAFLAYFSIGFLHYWRGLRLEIKEIKSELISYKRQKQSLFFQYLDPYDQICKIKYQGFLHEVLLQLLDEYEENVSSLNSKIGDFINSILKEKEEKFSQVMLPNNLFIRSVVTKNDLNKFVEKNINLQVGVERFFKNKPLSEYFDDFIDKGNIEALYQAIDDFTEEIFQFLREKSIEDIIKEGEKEYNISILEKMYNFYRSAKTYVLLDVEKGMDSSVSLSYLGVENTDNSYVKNNFDTLGYKDIQVYSLGNKHQITLTKLKIGIPAFHIALIKYGNALVSEINEREKLYVNPQWEIGNILPEKYMFSNEEDEARRITCLGYALGIISKKNEKYYLQDRELGKDYHEVINLFRSFFGSQIRVKVAELIKTEKEKEGALDKFSKFIENNKLDNVDRKIIEEIINELNPLT